MNVIGLVFLIMVLIVVICVMMTAQESSTVFYTLLVFICACLLIRFLSVETGGNIINISNHYVWYEKNGMEYLEKIDSINEVWYQEDTTDYIFYDESSEKCIIVLSDKEKAEKINEYLNKNSLPEETINLEKIKETGELLYSY